MSKAIQEEVNANNFDGFEDRQNMGRFQSTGVSELKRRYFKNRFDEKGYTYDPEMDPVVAKGISAYLAYPNYQGDKSLRTLLREGNAIDLDAIFSEYFSICFKFLSNREKKKLFAKDRFSDTQLIGEHIINEKEHFSASNELYEVVTQNEKDLIENIKKAATQYLVWINEATKNKSNQIKINDIDMNKEELDRKVENILKEIFPRITDAELTTLKGNLNGETKYLSLIYVGKIGNLYDKLNTLKRWGIGRQEILRVFENYIRWEKNEYSTSKELTFDGLNHKV